MSDDSLRRPGVTPGAASAAAVLGGAIDLHRFRLAGGTALAWHLGHRLSEDLDFFSFLPGAIDASDGSPLSVSLRERTDAGSIRPGERTLHASVGGCSVSFFEVDGRWFDPSTRVSEGIDLASVREIAAMKLVAVMTRCAKKDFYDLVAIADDGISLSQMIECGHRMYTGFAEALPHLRRSLAYFDEAESDPDPVSIGAASWQEIKYRVERLSLEYPWP